ncbi:MAG TPA: hypothetical protein VNU92_11615 [Edaphobacter sp.]|nr:hypothetical protein [Edaphobacter sp.]
MLDQPARETRGPSPKSSQDTADALSADVKDEYETERRTRRGSARTPGRQDDPERRPNTSGRASIVAVVQSANFREHDKMTFTRRLNRSGRLSPKRDAFSAP